jgi:microcystin-dependent protein
MLYELIGTSYGGDGQSSFALPDLRGRMVTGLGG